VTEVQQKKYLQKLFWLRCDLRGAQKHELSLEGWFTPSPYW